MAKLKVFAVWDNAVGAYLTPHVIQTRGLALRAFMDEGSRPESQFAKHPLDFSLFELGDYDDELGCFINHNAPVNLGTLSSLMTPSERAEKVFDQASVVQRKAVAKALNKEMQ